MKFHSAIFIPYLIIDRVHVQRFTFHHPRAIIYKKEDDGLDINNLLMGMDCPCGKKHTCKIQHVFIEKNAIARLAVLCADYQNILLVADENTFSAAGEPTLTALPGKKITKTELPKEVNRK